MSKSESRIQQEIVMSFRNTYCRNNCNPRYVIFSVPNESKDARSQATKIATGLMSGVSDLVVLLPGRVVFIEVKTETGRQSSSQVKFQTQVDTLGFEYYVVRSVSEFYAKIGLPEILIDSYETLTESPKAV